MSHMHRHDKFSITTTTVGARIYKVGHWCGREMNKKKKRKKKGEKKISAGSKKRTSNSNNIDSVYAEHIITNSISLWCLSLIHKKIDVYT